MSDTDIKMSDVFDLPISHDMDELRDCHGKELAAFNTCKQDEYAAHAINSHDALIERNKVLKAALVDLLQGGKHEYLTEIAIVRNARKALEQAK